MRLLEKNELHKAKAADRYKEISEGMKLSSKVDSLRELKVKEEEALSKWREETLTAIQLEISKIQAQKAELETEVSLLREEKEKGNKEVERRTDELDSWEDILTNRGDVIIEREVVLEAREQEVLAKLNLAEQELQRATARKEETEELYRQSLEDRKEAKITLMLARNEEEQVQIRKQKTEADLVQKGKVLTLRESSVDAREKDIISREKELNVVRKQLADQRATLERAMKRLQNGG